MKNDFRTRLQGESTILFDGAMGTMLYQKGVFLNRCFEEVSLSDPRLVLEIHREYLEAGADVLTTNSWGAGIPKLRAAGLEEKFAAINERAVQLARQAISDAGRDDAVFVSGSIGPLGVNIEPLGRLSAAEAEDLFEKQASALAAAGADLLILETFVDVGELAAAVRGARRACDLPLIASLTINNEGTSVYGTDPEVFTARIDELSPDAIGLNCSEGPRVMLETAEKMVRVTQRPLCVQPNAGVPLNVNGRNMYPTTPTYMAKYAKRMIQSGVRIVGGCCGTTPLHIREIRNEIRALQPSIPQERIRVVAAGSGARGSAPGEEEPLGLPPCPGGVRGLRGARAAQGHRLRQADRERDDPEKGGHRRGECARQPPGPGQDERVDGLRPPPAEVRAGSHPALHVQGQEPARPPG